MMPALSATLMDGTIVKWLVRVGDRVRRGDDLAVVQTAEGRFRVQALDTGRVERIIVPASGDPVIVNTPIAILTDDLGAGFAFKPALRRSPSPGTRLPAPGLLPTRMASQQPSRPRSAPVPLSKLGPSLASNAPTTVRLFYSSRRSNALADAELVALDLRQHGFIVESPQAVHLRATASISYVFEQDQAAALTLRMSLPANLKAISPLKLDPARVTVPRPGLVLVSLPS